MSEAPAIGDHDPVPLETAVRLFLQHARVTKHTLLAEIARGRLEHMRIGRKVLVTRAMVAAMLQCCKVPARAPEVRAVGRVGGPPMPQAVLDRMAAAKASLARNSAALKAGRKAVQ